MVESAASSQVFRFGAFELNCRSRELRKADGHVRLQEQPYQILKYLLEQAGQVVTRDELRQRVWPSSVYVDFDHGLNNAISALRVSLGDDASSPRYIETLPRLGYRFIGPVERIDAAPTHSRDVPARPVEEIPASQSSPVAAGRRWDNRAHALGLGSLVALALVGMLFGMSLWRQHALESNPGPEPVSVAVLPFTNMSRDPDNEHFADGLSEELIDQLAAIRELKVVSRSSSYRYKDADDSTAEMAEAMNANHLIEGSVRRIGSRVRVAVQLIDARDGYHVWSHVYDRELTDIFSVQEEVARSVASALRLALPAGVERSLPARPTTDAEAYRLYVIGLTLSRGGAEDLSRARDFFDKALARDPGFADARAGIALTYFRAAWVELTDVEPSIRLGLAAAQLAVESGANSGTAYLARANLEAWKYRFQGDASALARARLDFRRASELEPSNAYISFQHARALEWIDTPSAIRLYEQTAELDPHWDAALMRGAVLMSLQGNHDAARERLLELDAWSMLGTALPRAKIESHLGNLEEAVMLIGIDTHMRADEGLLLWGLLQSLGDSEDARKLLKGLCCNDVADALRSAALLAMDRRYPEAFQTLERQRKQFPLSRVLDLPTARLALITGHNERARTLLEERLPDMANGADPVNASNVMPALDLAAAYASTGRTDLARQLVARIAAFLDAPDAPHWPMFTYLRARAYVLGGSHTKALDALERAYDDGFRMLWALDLDLSPLYYFDPIDADPVFNPVRNEPRFQAWRRRIADDNARQLDQLHAHLAKSSQS